MDKIICGCGGQIRIIESKKYQRALVLCKKCGCHTSNHPTATKAIEAFKLATRVDSITLKQQDNNISFTERARRYVNQSPQTKGLPDSAKRRLIKGIAGMLSRAYKEGNGTLGAEKERNQR